MHPYLFEVLGLKIPSYGVMIALAYVVSYFYLMKKTKIYSISKDEISNILFYSVVGGFIGAKLFYIITFWNYFGYSFYEKIINIFSIETLRGGFVFYGGFLGGFLTFWLYIKKNKLDFYKVADLFSVALSLAHSIGRIGCFLAGCCHGRATDFFLGVVFTSPYCEVSHDLIGVKIHPSQLYESAGNFLIFLYLHSRIGKTESGNLFFRYVMMYSILRFIVEFTRGDDRGSFLIGLSQAQIISVFLIIGILLWKRLRK